MIETTTSPATPPSVKNGMENTRSYSINSLLTLEQAAAKLHVSVRTIRDWKYKRRIPWTRLGRRIYVDAGVVEELLARNAVTVLASSRSPGSKPIGQGGAVEGKSDRQ